MARIIFLSPQQPPLTHLFMVDRAVGSRRVNHRHDVLLVQFFLRALIQNVPGGPRIPLDGVCGQQTIDGIRYFQMLSIQGDSVREAAQRGGSGNNLRQIGLPAHNPDGSVRFVSGGAPTGIPQIQDGTSNTIVIGEQPPANSDPHVRQHYGTVLPPHYGEPLHGTMTIVRLNLAYCNAYGRERFRHIDHDSFFPRELFPALFGSIRGGASIREAASRSGEQNNLRQIGP
jgi:hypothetical protein